MDMDMGSVTGTEVAAEAEAGVDTVDTCVSPWRQRRDEREMWAQLIGGSGSGRAQRMHRGGRPIGIGEKRS
jgi:hypothetical protein